jgi:hypothetical protein
MYQIFFLNDVSQFHVIYHFEMSSISLRGKIIILLMY